MTMMPRMRAALELTKAGQLSEAMALLRHDLDTASTRRQGAPPFKVPRSDIDLVPSKIEGVTRTMASRPVAAPPSSSFTWHRMTNPAGYRRFKLFVPPGATTAPRPLVMMLHGCTQSPEDFATGTGMNEIADEMGFVVAYPEQTAAHNCSKCWNWFRPGDQVRGRGEPADLAAIVTDVMHKVAIDPARVFVAGLSAGGAAAAILAREYPDLFRGVGVHSGLACGAARDLPSALAAMKKGAPACKIGSNRVPAITFHGDADATVNPVNARHVLQDVIAGLDAPVVERGRIAGGNAFVREIWRDVDGRTCAEAWTIEGAGHAWSGGSPAGTYTEPRGPDASRAMLRFFTRLRA